MDIVGSGSAMLAHQHRLTNKLRLLVEYIADRPFVRCLSCSRKCCNLVCQLPLSYSGWLSFYVKVRLILMSRTAAALVVFVTDST